jgi:hypothetical protein
MAAPKWTVTSGYSFPEIEERTLQNINLPLSSTDNVTVKVISGQLPPGLRISESVITGSAFEVVRNTVFKAVLRATNADGIADITVNFPVVGPDAPTWLTPEGDLLAGVNSSAFVLDSTIVDFQLQAIDADLPAGDSLKYYIADGDGELPPGLSLSTSGRITGVVDPIRALDVNADPGYDTTAYDAYPIDFGVPDGDGFDSYYYDSVPYGTFIPTRVPRKLNRKYQFRVTVEDSVTKSTRLFAIFVVGDDFARADNTLMKAGNGTFTSDLTYLRDPVWLTPADLGIRRADNYQTIYLDTLDPKEILGRLSYNLQEFNDDGTESVVPPGLVLDTSTGELAGRIGYQPAVTKDYKFTVEAIRIENDIDYVTIVFNWYEDTLTGTKFVKISKLLDIADDEIADLETLVGRTVDIDNRQYTVNTVDNSNELFDILELNTPLVATYRASALNVVKTANVGDDSIFVETLSEADKNFYIGKKLNYSANEQYQIKQTTQEVDQGIFPYIEYTISTNSPTNALQINYSSVGLEQGSDYLTGIDAVITEFTRISENNVGISRPAFRLGAEANRCTIALPQYADTLNQELVKKLFHSEDSTPLTITVEEKYDRVVFDKNLQRGFGVGASISLGLTAGGVVEKTVRADKEEVSSTSKTFSVKILGEIDSVITWNTPTNLGTILANRICDIKVEASSTITDPFIQYYLTAGSLPPGLRLLRDGELVGKVNQFGSINYQGYWKANREYAKDEVVVYNDVYYKALSLHSAAAFSTDNWEQTTITDPGLVKFETGFSVDGGTTTFDKEYTFTILAKDRLGYSATSRTFTLNVNDVDDIEYSNLFMQPFIKRNIKEKFLTLMNFDRVFTPESIYRPSDDNFGVQKNLRALVYAGIQTKDKGHYVGAIAKNARKKKYKLGDIKTAIAKNPGSSDTVYEVIYVEVVDPQESTRDDRDTNDIIKTNSGAPITVDSVDLEVKDDNSALTTGSSSFVITSNSGNTLKVPRGATGLEVVTRTATEIVETEGIFVTIFLRDGLVAVVEETSFLEVVTSAPERPRPNYATITADSDAILVSQDQDIRKHLSNISNMRKNIAKIGNTDNSFLPLWMRTQQEIGEPIVEYKLAIPLVYCKPGTSNDILLNINNYLNTEDFDINEIDYEIDRLIIDAVEGESREQYLVFENYSHNV